MRYEIDGRTGSSLAVVTTHGQGTLEGFRAFTADLVGRRLPSVTVPVLVDHRDLDLSTMQKPDVDAFRRYVADLLSTIRREPGAGTPRLATLVARRLDFGIVRQWEIPLEGAVPIVHRTFLDPDAALAWLTARGEETPADE